MAGLVPPTIMTPRHVHGVRTAAEYRERQAAAIASWRQHYPSLPWRTPWRYDGEPPPVFVSGGKWLIECACGNCPSVAPEWGGLACCFECGAIYEGCVMPEHAAEIARALAKRPRLIQRYWRPGLTIDDLQRENALLGVTEED